MSLYPSLDHPEAEFSGIMGGETRPPYPEEYRARIIEPVRAGRNPEDLAPELEPSGQTIRNWVRQAFLDQRHQILADE